MPVHPTQPHRPPRQGQGGTQRTSTRRASLTDESRAAYIVALLLAITLVVLCIVIFVVARELISDSSPIVLPVSGTEPAGPASQPTTPGRTPGTAQVSLDPTQGYINTLVAIRGWGWWPEEPVFVFLRAPGEGDGPRYAYAAAVANEQGEISTAFTFPNEVRWVGEEWADVIARGNRSELEASARFTLVAPTPTITLPAITLPPSVPATNTAPPTETPLPMTTPTGVGSPTTEAITDWRGEYFANMALAGAPVLVRNDVSVDFYWGTAPPGTGVPADEFSARWTRSQVFQQGNYRFSIGADDGVRFWIDGRLLVDDWQDGPLRPHSLDLYLPAGEHSLHVEYYEHLGDAGIALTWMQIEMPTPTPTPTSTPQVVPTETPTATPGPTDTPPPSPTSPPALPDTWQAQYYANDSLSGDAVLVREDAKLNFDWGAGSPGEGVPADNFSARWTRDVWVPAGTYRFFAEADDGVRFWVDNQLLIDEWHLGTGVTYDTQIQLAEGVHSLRVEYFEAFLDASIRLWGDKAAE